jgi:hypothetical protein
MGSRVEPKRRMLLDLPVDAGGYAFNPTLLPGGDDIVCVYRHVATDGVRTLRSCRLDENFHAHDARCWSDQARAMGAVQTWFADPRAFRSGDRFFVSFNTGHSEYPNGLYLTEVSASGQPLAAPMKLRQQGGRRGIEKNWGFFEVGGKLYCVYSVSPFVVLEIAPDGFTSIFAIHDWHSTAVERAYGPLRGGASPIRVANRFYMVVQSHTEEGGRLWYSGSLIVFDATPPFRPLRYATEPLFELTDDERDIRSDLPLNPRVVECLYPSGATIVADDLLLTYGINDFRSGLRVYSLAALERAVAPVVPKLQTDADDSTHASPSSVLRTFFWEPSFRPRRTPEDIAAGRLRAGNAGDSLQHLIATKLFGAPCLNTDERGPRLLGVGSIAHRMRAGDVIWGSGHKPVVPKITPAEAATVRALAVRGPLTLNYLAQHGVDTSTVRSFFDPGLLLEELLAEEVAVLRAQILPQHDVLYIPHYSDTLRFEALYGRTGRRVATMDQDLLGLVAEILAADLVVASSLHGLIFAEALGVPAVLHRPPATEYQIKYVDYYEGTGRPSFPVLEDGENPAFVRGLDPPRIPPGWRETIPSVESLSRAGIVEPVVRFACDGSSALPKTADGASPGELVIDVAACFDDMIVLEVELSRAPEGSLAVLHGDRTLISLSLEGERLDYEIAVPLTGLLPSDTLLRLRLVGPCAERETGFAGLAARILPS